MTEKKEKILEIHFDEFIPDIVRGLDRMDDSWVYRKLIKLFVTDFSNTEDYEEIFEAIAGNPNTSIELLNILKKYEDEDVRVAVALNPNTPINILRELSHDESPYIRMAILRRDNVEVEFLELLSDDDGEDRDDEFDEFLGYYKDNPEVAIGKLQEVVENLDEESSEYYEEDDEDDEYIYHDFNGFHDFNDLDSDEIISEMRQLIASNIKTPAKILKKLSRDKDINVKIEVARNKKTSFSVLQKLSSDEREEVRASILLTERKNIKIKLYIKGHLEWINR